MTLLRRLLLILSALAYTAMPYGGMGGASAFAGIMIEDMAVTAKAPMTDTVAAAPDAGMRHQPDCPHAGPVVDADIDKDGADGGKAGSQMTGHCVACLTLVAVSPPSPLGNPTRAAQTPFLPKPLTSADRMPSVPPPRA